MLVTSQLLTETVPTDACWAAARLAPLQVCLPTVVDEFTRQAQKFGLMDCKGLLPGELKRAQRPLEMFFPFDPFLLRRSAQVLARCSTCAATCCYYIVLFALAYPTLFSEAL